MGKLRLRIFGLRVLGPWVSVEARTITNYMQRYYAVELRLATNYTVLSPNLTLMVTASTLTLESLEPNLLAVLEISMESLV